MNNFDPYLDWEKIDQEVALELHRAVKRQKRAQELFEKTPPDSPHFTKIAQTFVRTAARSTKLMGEIREIIYTKPVMVHVAGEKKQETNPDNPEQEGIVQRCSRCGSVLQLWSEGMMALDQNGPHRVSEEETNWHSVGTILAKGETGLFGQTEMYEIEKGRELEKHEKECVSLEGIFGDSAPDFDALFEDEDKG